MPTIRVSPKVYRNLMGLQEEIINKDIEDGGIEADAREFWGFDNLIEFMVYDVRDRTEQLEKRIRAKRPQKPQR